MKKKSRAVTYTIEEREAAVLREASAPFPSAAAASQETVSVRTAKATLSALLEMVAKGGQILITSDGRPKARLVPVEVPRRRKTFDGSSSHLATMPAWTGGMDSTEIIGADRDDR